MHKNYLLEWTQNYLIMHQMQDKDIIIILEKNCKFYTELNNANKRKFLRRVKKFLRNHKIISDNNHREEKILIAATASQITYGLGNYTFLFLNNVNIKTHNALFKQVLTTFYIDYLNSSASNKHLDNYIMDVELGIEEIFSNNNSISQSPIIRFADIVERFFCDAENFKKNNQDIFNKLCVLFIQDPSNYLSNFSVTKEIFTLIKNNKKDIKKARAYFINYVAVSTFIGSFVLLYSAPKILINYSYVFLCIIMLSTVSYFLFLPKLKSVKKEILNYIPYLFFCIFGIGVNTIAILLAINVIFSNNEQHIKGYTFTHDEIELINVSVEMSEDKGEVSIVHRTIKVKFEDKNLYKRLNFTIPMNKLPVSKYTVTTNKGILGLEVIKNKSAD